MQDSLKPPLSRVGGGPQKITELQKITEDYRSHRQGFLKTPERCRGQEYPALFSAVRFFIGQSHACGMGETHFMLSIGILSGTADLYHVFDHVMQEISLHGVGRFIVDFLAVAAACDQAARPQLL